jgi:ABC-type enterobactin transport system permease subunit
MGFGGCGFEKGAIRSFLARWRVPVALTGVLFVGEELMVPGALFCPLYNHLPDIRRTVTSTR